MLRVLEVGEMERVGSSKTKRVDVRVISATNANLEEEVQGGRFRQDLLFRLNTIEIHLPPLRERR
jgi:transcriptional regulator with GAF, ATPase, and Fis domain